MGGEAQRTLIVADAAVERRSIFRSTFGPESLLLVPMAYGDEVHGVLVVSKAGADRYGPEDEQALSIFGRYCRPGHRQCRQHRASGASAGHSGAPAGRRAPAPGRQRAAGLHPGSAPGPRADRGHDRQRGPLRPSDDLPPRSRVRRHRAGHLTRELRCGPVSDATRHALDEGLTSWVIGRGDAVCANDIADGVLAGALEGTLEPGIVRPSSQGSDEAGRIAQNVIVVPLRVHGEVVGSLNLGRVGGAEAHFSEPEFELSKLFAGQASIALQNAEMHVTVSTRADLDALTGLRNHGTFQRDLDALVEAGEPFSVLMMDLDSFKAFNDTYGHPAGDALLQTVAKAIVGATRQNDRAYRYGGDEFALLLLGASRTHAEEVAGRVRVAVREAVRVSPVGGEGLPFGASIGAAHWPADGPGKAELVGAADAALYEAKRRRATRSGGSSHSVPEAVPGAILDAARDLLAASCADDIARATLRHAAAIVGSRDGLIAFTNDGRGSAAGDTPMMRKLAGMGTFEEAGLSIRPGEGFWGRVWSGGGVLAEDGGEDGVLLGVPIAVDGQVSGVVGVGLPAAAVVSPERIRMLDHLAALAGAAVQRLTPPTGDGG